MNNDMKRLTLEAWAKILLMDGVIEVNMYNKLIGSIKNKWRH